MDLSKYAAGTRKFMSMELTKSERIDELRAYSLWYGIGRAAKLGRGLILYQTHDNRWSAFLRAGKTEHQTSGWDSPSSAVSALVDAVEGR